MQIGLPDPLSGIPAFPGGFHSAPRSLRAALRAMVRPQCETWLNVSTHHYSGETWTHECQGLTTDGQFWYVASNNPDHRGIHKLSLDFNESFGSTLLPVEEGIHVGDLEYWNGRIFVAVDDPVSKVWVLNQNLSTLEITLLDPAVNFFMGWCAINPWNGMLYSSQGSGADRIHFYDPNERFKFKGSLLLAGPAVNGIQGGCFSPNGHLYLTSDIYVDENATKDIRAYSALNGAFLGSCPVIYDPSTLEAEEMEGLAISTFVVDGIETHIHVVILDNDWPSNDDVIVKHFRSPYPADL